MNDIYEFVSDNKINESKLLEELSIIAANIDIKCFRCKAVKSFKISELLSFEAMYQFAFPEATKDKNNHIDLALYI
ncbi:hypothetical protein QE109_04505 [Fusibacter bizertensis]|uniref:Uncharacterized protein n=1 Tax=Fusibacter bizertensis TaxID=1488331 RepID=A0ABT6NAH0_9FIRM|nr:hypothetical protein [Fusibacter bizertensis]MDH8677395.1 hypothetical protein [Fusibacter bizertensis]